MAEGIRAALQKGNGNIPGIRGPQNGSQIPRVLNAVQQQHSLFRPEFPFLRQPAQEHRPLGALHGRNGLHNLPAHPNNPAAFRHPGLRSVRQKNRVKARAMPHRLFQELGAVGDEQSQPFPLPFGGQQLLHLLDQGVPSGSDPLLHHSLCTFSRETLSPSITRVSPSPTA